MVEDLLDGHDKAPKLSLDKHSNFIALQRFPYC